MPRSKLELARAMRRDPTPAERLLWSRLKDQAIGFKFRQQAPMWGYIADFYCAASLLVVEVDGSVHEASKDALRDARLALHGIVTIRFTNEEVFSDVGRVLYDIKRAAFANGQRNSKKATRRHNPAQPHRTPADGYKRP